jgi:hypothetical protein
MVDRFCLVAVEQHAARKSYRPIRPQGFLRQYAWRSQPKQWN